MHKVLTLSFIYFGKLNFISFHMRSLVIVYHNHIIVLLDLNGMSSEVLIHLFDFQEGEGDEDGEDEGDDGEDEG